MHKDDNKLQLQRWPDHFIHVLTWVSLPYFNIDGILRVAHNKLQLQRWPPGSLHLFMWGHLSPDTIGRTRQGIPTKTANLALTSEHALLTRLAGPAKPFPPNSAKPRLFHNKIWESQWALFTRLLCRRGLILVFLHVIDMQIILDYSDMSKIKDMLRGLKCFCRVLAIQILDISKSFVFFRIGSLPSGTPGKRSVYTDAMIAKVLGFRVSLIMLFATCCVAAETFCRMTRGSFFIIPE